MILRPFVLPIEPGRSVRGDVRIPEGPPPRSAVLVVHGFKGFKDWGFFPHVSESLAAEGHAVVSFNFSLNGISDDGETFGRLNDFARNTFSAELGELLRVIDEVREGSLFPRPVRRVGLLGHSRGGAIAVLAARERLRAPEAVHALVTWGAVANLDRWSEETRAEWRSSGRIHVMNQRTGQHMPLDVSLLEDFETHRKRLDLERASAQVTLPWLVVHGEADTTVPVTEAHRLIGANPRARLEIIQDAGHTFEARHPFAGTTPALNQALLATRRHFERPLSSRVES